MGNFITGRDRILGLGANCHLGWHMLHVGLDKIWDMSGQDRVSDRRGRGKVLGKVTF